MIKNKRAVAIATSLLICLVNIQAQHFKSIGVRDGLTDTCVESIAKDRYGYVWFATLNGLNRFDGYNIKKYSLKDFGLNFDQFKYVAEDKEGNIWTVSATGTVYLFDREKDCLTKNLNYALAPLGIYSDKITLIRVDDIGNLWIGANRTLYHYDYTQAKLSTYELPHPCFDVDSDGKDTYLSLHDGRIMHLAPTPPHEKFETIKNGEGRPSLMMLDSDGRLWTYGPLMFGKVMYYDKIRKTWNKLPDNELTDNDFTVAAVDDRNGHILFGSNSNGIISFSKDLSEYKIIKHVSENPLTIPSNHISCLYLSDDNILWIGTNRNGVALTSTEDMNISQISININEDVKTVIENSDGDYWIGMDGKGLLKYSVKDGSFRHFSANDGSIPSENIVGSSMLSDGSLVFSTYGGGAFKWNGSNSIRFSCNDENFHNEIKYCREAVEDNSGNVWFLTFNRGVVCLMPDGSWKKFNRENSELISNHMTSITYSPEHDRLFVSNMECIYEISTQTLELTRFKIFDQVTVLHLDKRCILWVGTTDGLWYRELKKDSEFNCLDVSDGLSHSHIKGIAADIKEDIWVTTNDGFTCIYVINDPLKNSIETRCFPYYAEDGIGTGVFCYNSIYCTRNGAILMGNDGKVIQAEPFINIYSKKRPALELTYASVSGEEVHINDFNKNIYSNKLKIGHNDNLSLKVSAMDYLNRNKIKYEYNISGSEEWILMQGNQMFLNRLPSGNHTLSFRMAGSHYPECTSHLSVIVKPPFWKSTIAMIIYAALFILSCLFIIKFMQNRNRRRLDKERNEMNEAKILFFTNISHDLRTPLTMIITPLQKLMRENKNTELEADLDLIYRSATTLMNEVNQLLDFKKMNDAKVNFNPSYGDFVRYVNEILESYNLISCDDSIKLTKEICDERIMMDFDRNKIMRILHNLISNAFKYNHAKGYVKVSLHRNGDHVELSVTDSGTGIDDLHKPFIYDRFYQAHNNEALSGNGIGLHIVKEYVELHHGTISVSDNYPSGCIFTVRIPITHVSIPEESLENLTDEENAHEDSAGVGQEEEKPKILIVEDNLPFRKFLKTSLSDRYKIYEAGNGRAALESLEKHSISIIVSDVMMPEIDGLELCHKVKNDIRYSHIPIILLTAIQNKEMVIKSLRDGADEYISKPFDVEMLTLKIDKILRWSQENYERFSSYGTQVSDLTISRLDEELLKKAVDAIERNLSDSEYSVEDLSLEIGISRSGLYKKMMFITGKSPIEFIRTIKIKKGRNMIEEGETSISQVAWSVGFSPKQFSRYFKEEYGCLPSEFLKHIRQDV